MTQPTVHLVFTCGDDLYDQDEIAHVFATAEAAQAYADQIKVPRTARVCTMPVLTEAPRRVRIYRFGWAVSVYQSGGRHWDGPLAPENIDLEPLTDDHDVDDLPPGTEEVPVQVERDDRRGYLSVRGTDEQAVRRAAVEQVREMLAAAGLAED